MSQRISGFYVSFSGEPKSGNPPIPSVYALDTHGKTKNTQVLGPSESYPELRGMTFGPDGNFYVAQAHQTESAILQFAGMPAAGGTTLNLIGNFVTPANSPGLVHPYQPVFDGNGNLYVSSQDSNVVTGFYGPKSTNPAPGTAMPLSQFLLTTYPQGSFYLGTFVPAWSAKTTVPTPVPTDQGGLTFTTDKGGATHSVRGVAFDSAGYLYVADEGNDRVAVFQTDGTFYGAITTSKDHALSGPVALCFDASSGTLYIGSPGNGRLFSYDVSQVAKQDFTANVLINDSKLDKMSGIASDGGGSLYIGERKTNRIYKASVSSGSLDAFAGPFSDAPEQIVAVCGAVA